MFLSPLFDKILTHKDENTLFYFSKEVIDE